MGSSLFPRQNQAPAQSNSAVPNLSHLQQFAALMNGRNPKQLVMNLVQQRGIPSEELDNVMRQAQQIASMFGLK